MSGNFFVATGAAYSSNDTTWRTPTAFFEKLNELYGPFDVDAAATEENSLCPEHYDDALNHPWGGAIFCNPPYDRNLKRWMQHAYEQRNNCEIIVMLVPARTDTAYWSQWVYGHADEVRFVEGRLSFSDSKTSAAFGSAVVIYRPDRVKTDYGTIGR